MTTTSRLLLLALSLLAGCSESPAARDAAREAASPREAGQPGELRLGLEPGPPREASAPREAGSPDQKTPALDGPTAGVGLAATYPGDKGIETDPQVVFAENFEEGSVAAVVARYESHQNTAGMSLVSAVPAKSAGKAALSMVAGGAHPATDLYRRLQPGYDQLYLRYYVKYDPGVTWHHTGVWIGGYNPSLAWPNPQAGLKPAGDDRFSISIEPMGAGASPGPRLDFYNYWMKMHSWMTTPSGSTAYYGNTLVHKKGFQVVNGGWMCIEIMAKLNPSASSGAGAELAVWKDDALVQHFTGTSSLGYWIKDKFCPTSADSPECTDYPPPSGTVMIPLDLQVRSTTALKLNYLWPQNYITEGPAGAVTYDDLVVAKVRIGCLK